ncbi:autotransporter domain-containing protein [Bradyrhizobium sp. 18BD]
MGNTCTVTIASDPGTASSGTTGAAGTLSYALAYANAQSSPITINIQTNVTLSGPLSPIFNSLTINGNGHTIDGSGTQRIFFVGVDTATQTSAAVAGSIVAQTQNVSINNVTLSNGLAQGGAGGSGAGGGMGAGGALFVNQSANVSLSGVSFTNNRAIGGAGTAYSSLQAGGGGGLGGAGGVATYSSSAAGGGGGLFGSGGGNWGGGGGVFGNGGTFAAGGGGYSGNGGTYVTSPGNGAAGLLSVSGLTGGGGAGGVSSGVGNNGGANGGGGGTQITTAQGGGGGFGGGNGTYPTSNAAVAGGFGGFGGGGGNGGNGGGGGDGGYGGGGGSGDANGGKGGFGGGGGGTASLALATNTGGTGGFGGGGGSATMSYFLGSATGVGGSGGFGGGGGAGFNASGAGGFGAGDATAAAGGGGAAMGGSVFVAKGGTLTIVGDGSTSGGSATGGTGGNAGSAIGSGIFVQGSALAFGAGNFTVSDVIADQNGSGGSSAADGFGGTGGQSSITKSNGGTLTLLAANTYGGGTTINEGSMLVVGNAQALGTGTLTLNGGTTGVTVTFNGNYTIANNIAATGDPIYNVLTGNTVNLMGVLSGSGDVVVNQASGYAGTLILSGANAYTGGTFINAGTLTLNHQTGGVIDAAGTGGISFTGSAGTLRTSLTATLSNSITSNSNTTGTISVATGQTLTFNGVLYQHGNLVFGSATDQGTVIWSAPGEVLYGGTLRVAGGTLKAGSSPLGNALGDMTYVAQTTVDAGATLDFSNQSGSINNLHGGGNVTVGTGLLTLVNGGDFSGNIFGSGGLKLASGTLVLSGNNTYTGATTVNGGTLDVEGSITGTSSVTVNAGGTLTGTGLVDPLVVTIASGGTLAPGNGVAGSSLAIEGNLALQSGAIYLVQVNPSAASFVTVTGSATLGGATVNAVFANGSYVSKTYTILSTSRGVSGTFDPSVVNTNLPANFHSTLSYDANNAYLNLVLNFAIPGGLNGNQQAVGNALTNFFNANGSIPLVYGGLTPAGLTQASGELATAPQQTTFDAMSQFMGLLSDPFMQRNGVSDSARGASGFADEDSASAYAERKRTDAFAMVTKAPSRSFEQRWSVWAAGFGGSQSTDGNAATGSNDATSRIAGTAVGADYRLSPNTLLGFALAGGGTSFSVANGLGSGRSDLFQAGAYLRHTNGPAYISAALAYGWQNITTDRTVTIAGADRLRAAFDANAYSGRLEGGYRFVVPGVGGIGVTPYGAAQFTTLDLPAYAEQVVAGSAAFALSYAAKSVTDTRSELGLRTDKAFALRDGVLTLRGRVAWAHDFNPDRSIATTFQALPGASFVANGAAQARDSALTTAAVEMSWLNGWSAGATFEGEFSSVTRSYAGKGSVRYAW